MDICLQAVCKSSKIVYMSYAIQLNVDGGYTVAEKVECVFETPPTLHPDSTYTVNSTPGRELPALQAGNPQYLSLGTADFSVGRCATCKVRSLYCI